MRLCSIASGSSGNCIYIGTDNAHVIVDAGISGKKIGTGIEHLDIKPEELDGILITHEHSDHISGLGVMARRYGLPIYATGQTVNAIRNTKSIGKIPDQLFVPILPDRCFCIKDMQVCPVSIYHDAVDPVAYRFQSGKQSIGVLTDIGKFDNYIIESFQELDILLLEANHDIHMLQAGGYPYYLKQRILGDYGHLSNESSGRLLDCLLNDRLKHVILGHLSKENNYAQLAYETVRLEIDMSESQYRACDFELTVANRDSVSQPVQI